MSRFVETGKELKGTREKPRSDNPSVPRTFFLASIKTGFVALFDWKVSLLFALTRRQCTLLIDGAPIGLCPLSAVTCQWPENEAEARLVVNVAALSMFRKRMLRLKNGETVMDVIVPVYVEEMKKKKAGAKQLFTTRRLWS